jgi:hypothetical protein
MQETQETINGGDESEEALAHATHACQCAPTMFRLVLLQCKASRSSLIAHINDSE